MSGNISFNPQLTTVASGSFNIETTGYIQGTALQDPAVRFELAGGVVASTETVPMWGGIAVTENVPGLNPGNSLGGSVARATAETNITGWTVFDQNHAMINFPQSPVPLAAPGMQVNFYRLGSNARIAVKCDPNLIDLAGNAITGAVAWDYENEQLVPYVSASVTSGTQATAATISSGTYNAATGAVSLTTNAAHGLLPGDTFTLASMTGTNAATYLDGSFVATAGTTGSTLNFNVINGLTLTITGGDLKTVGISMGTVAPHGLLPGDTFVMSAFTGTGFSQLAGTQTATVGTAGSTLNIVASSALTSITFTAATVSNGTALPVRVLDVQSGNSQTVDYDSVSGFATWNRNGTTAVILV